MALLCIHLFLLPFSIEFLVGNVVGIVHGNTNVECIQMYLIIIINLQAQIPNHVIFTAFSDIQIARPEPAPQEWGGWKQSAVSARMESYDRFEMLASVGQPKSKSLARDKLQNTWKKLAVPEIEYNFNFYGYSIRTTSIIRNEQDGKTTDRAEKRHETRRITTTKKKKITSYSIHRHIKNRNIITANCFVCECRFPMQKCTQSLSINNQRQRRMNESEKCGK